MPLSGCIGASRRTIIPGRENTTITEGIPDGWNGAQQAQFKDCVFNMGLSETQVDERAVSVFNELIPKALEAYTQDAYATTNQ